MKISKEQFRNAWMEQYSTTTLYSDSPNSKNLARGFTAVCTKLGIPFFLIDDSYEAFDYQSFVSEIANVEGFNKVATIYKELENVDHLISRIFTRNDSLALCSPRISDFGFNPNNCSTHVEVYSTDEGQINRIKELIKKFTLEANELKNINFIVNSPEGIALAPINNFKTQPMIRENYQEYVLKGFDNMVAQIMSEQPSGRLHLLEGPPGTGKTRFIQGLVDEINAKFVFVPVMEAASLLSPDFMTLMSYEVSNNRAPVVIILEDSEALLQKRKKTGHTEAAMISGILNLCDSPIAAGLNLHIISTFNAKLDDFDDAIKRKGRLATHIKFSELSFEHAKAVYAREGGGSGLTEDRPYTLAEVYAETKEVQVEFLPEEAKKDGLGVYN